MWRRRSAHGVAHEWPVELTGRTPRGERIVMRPLAKADQEVYQSTRRANALWLARWDATSPDDSAPLRTFAQLVEHYDDEARAGRMLPLVIELQNRIVGQMNVANITHGSFRSCTVGYWVTRLVAGRGITPTALALVADYLFGHLAMHRIEVNIRPENDASLAVMAKLGFRDEGMRLRMLHIDGEWRDHRSFAVTTEDLQDETFMERLLRLSSPSSQQSLWRHTGPDA